MPDPIQGLPSQEPATSQGQGLPQQEPAGQIDLTPYLPDAPQNPAVGQEPQGQPAAPPSDANQPHYQTLYNQTLAEKLALQQQLQALTQASQPQTQQGDPRPDPQTDWAGYLKWEIRSGQRELLQQFREEEKRNWQGALQQASDMEWARQHPNLDIGQVKAFAQARQIGNLDDAATLMTLPQMVNQVQRNASNQTMNNFRQPVTNPFAAPIRPGGGTQGPTQLVFAKLAQEYQETFGKAYESWTPDMRAAFDKEWGQLEASRGSNGRR